MIEKIIVTRWNIRIDDVWGNADDGWQVITNHLACNIELLLAVKTHNLDCEFQSASPTDEQISQIFGKDIEIRGINDTVLWIDRASDSKPLGEMSCTSHKSLSPIREN